MTLSLPCSCGDTLCPAAASSYRDCSGGVTDGSAGGSSVQATLVGLATVQGAERVGAILGALRSQWEAEHGLLK
jgi:hypothetical protein